MIAFGGKREMGEKNEKRPPRTGWGSLSPVE
jgi:hypothetical protein